MNMFQVNNKYNRTTSIDVAELSLLLPLNIFGKIFSILISAFVHNFKHVFACLGIMYSRDFTKIVKIAFFKRTSGWFLNN